MRGRVNTGLPLRRLAHVSNGQLESSQFLTAPIPAKPMQFGNLSLDDRDYEMDMPQTVADSDTRLMEMLAAQAAHRDGSAPEDEDKIVSDDQLSPETKKDMLQKTLNMAASNGDVERIRKLLGGQAKQYVDVNATDEEGTAPLIYASCFVSESRASCEMIVT